MTSSTVTAAGREGRSAGLVRTRTWDLVVAAAMVGWTAVLFALARDAF